MDNQVWKFATSGQCVFGRSAVYQVGHVCKRYGISKPLVVTDRNLLSHGLLEPLFRALKEEEIHFVLFEEGEAEPSLAVAAAAGRSAQKHQVDSIIGVGGGSNLDVAKGAAIVLKHGGTFSDYLGFDAVPGPLLPLIAIPTTAGTGSEVSNSAVLTDPDRSMKVSAISPWLRPTVAVIDPQLGDSCPGIVTAHSGVDTLVHAIEAYTARTFQWSSEPNSQARPYEGSNPMGRLLASEAIRLVGHHLLALVKSPSHAESRDSMSWAACLAGMAFSNCGVALVHALEYPIGATLHCSHGEGNGLLLPHVLRFLRPACVVEFAQISDLLGIESRGSDEDRSWLLIHHIEGLLDQIGIRKRLRDLGCDYAQLPTFAEKTFSIKRLLQLSPREPTFQELIGILEQAW